MKNQVRGGRRAVDRGPPITAPLPRSAAPPPRPHGISGATVVLLSPVGTGAVIHEPVPIPSPTAGAVLVQQRPHPCPSPSPAA